MSPRPRRRVLHTADLHIGTAGDDGCRSLAAVTALAAVSRVDLLVIAGDLFDHNKVEAGLVGAVAAELRRLPVPVVILPGNHDCLAPGSVYEHRAFRDGQGSIFLMHEPAGGWLHLPELDISLWGRPFDSHDGDVRPLAGLPLAPPDGRWHVALGHGYFVDGGGPVLFPSYHISRRDIERPGWDYLALGHVPVFRCVSREPVPAYYCGSPPLTGTVALVELDDGGVRVSRGTLLMR